MSRLKTFLLVLLAGLAAGLAGRALWSLIAPPVLGWATGVPELFGSVPVWVWWTLFGIAMSLICPLKVYFFGRRCGRHTCA